MIKRRKKGEETRARKCVYSFKEILFIILMNEENLDGDIFGNIKR